MRISCSGSVCSIHGRGGASLADGALALAVVVLFGLAFLTGALSAAAARRFEAGVSDGRPPDAGSGS